MTSVPQTAIFVGNLDRETTEFEVEAFLADYGLVSFELARDGFGDSKGYGHALIDARHEANLLAQHGQNINAQPVRIERADG